MRLQKFSAAKAGRLCAISSANTSGCHLTRLFLRELERPSGRWLENAHLEKARERLEAGRSPLKAMPEACGYRSGDVKRRAFVKRNGIALALY